MWCWGMSILIRSDKKVKFEYEKRNQQPIHPIHTVTSIFWNLEKTLILEKTEGGRRRGRQRTTQGRVPSQGTVWPASHTSAWKTSSFSRYRW